MLIDVHGHIGFHTPHAVPPARLATYAGVCGLDWVLVSNRDAACEPAGAPNLSELDANTACLEACRKHAHLIPLYWVRVGQPDSLVQAVAGALQIEPFVGAVFSPAETGLTANDARIEPYLAVLAEGGYPAIFCITDDPRTDATALYNQIRPLVTPPVVFCPAGASAPQRSAALEAARRALQNQDVDLYLATGHASAQEIRTAVHMLGPERVLFGTNAIAYGDSHVPRHISILDELRRTLAPDEFDRVTSENARQLFRLEPPAA